MSSFDNSDAEFQRHSQFISTSVQKIYQNGKYSIPVIKNIEINVKFQFVPKFLR
jgi:flagellar basal body L-ring protein FlgH